MKHDKLFDHYNRTKGGYIFKTRKCPIINKFIIPEVGERLKIKFSTLISLVKSSVSFDKTVIQRIKEIINNFDFSRNFSIGEDSKSSPSWNGETLKSQGIETIVLSNASNAKSETIVNKKTNKTRFLYYGSELVLNETSRINLYSHYNAADLSMLEDWAEISKRNIDILKKSYTSLRVPMKVSGENVYIKDTLLLSSAAASSLSAVGAAHKLYKKALSKKEQENMNVLFKENPEKFKDYAMTDSLITLIHALFMNDFVFNLGYISFPSTLGSIATKYLQNQ